MISRVGSPLISAVVSALITLPVIPVMAQMSPVCERNGRRDYCALTPVPGSSTARQQVDLIMFADNSVYRVDRDLRSCRRITEKLETCSARITAPPAGSPSFAALYRATFFEGGVKHELIGKGLRISYHVAD